MGYYLLNVSKRLRDRRLFNDLQINGRRLVPNVRQLVTDGELKANFDTIYNWAAAGAVEVRDQRTGTPVDVRGLKVTMMGEAPEKKAPKAEKASTPAPAPEPEPKVAEPAEAETPSLGEIFDMDDERKAAAAPVGEVEPPVEIAEKKGKRGKRSKKSRDGGKDR